MGRRSPDPLTMIQDEEADFAEGGEDIQMRVQNRVLHEIAIQLDRIADCMEAQDR